MSDRRNSGRLADVVRGALVAWIGLGLTVHVGWMVGELAISWSGHAAVVAAGLAVLDVSRRRWRRAAVLALAAVVGGAPWGLSAVEARAPAVRDGADTIAVLVANPFHSPPRRDALIAAIEGSGADLVGLLEPPATLAGALAATGRWEVLATHAAAPPKYNVGLVVRTAALAPAGPLEVRRAEVRRRDFTESATVRAELLWRGQPFTVVVAHAPAPTSRRQQAERLELIPQLALRTRVEAPALLIADLNTTRASPVWRGLLGRGHLRRPRGGSPASWPSLLGPLGIAIDYVLVTSPFEVGEPEVVELPGSDHRAVRVQVALPTTPRPQAAPEE